MSAATALWAAPPGNTASVRLLDDDSSIGHPYQPVGDWKEPGELIITLRVPLDDGSTVEAGSLRSEVQGDLIRLYFVSSKLAKVGKKTGDAQVCKPYVAGAELIYSLRNIPRQDYRVELLGSNPVPPALLYTLQRAKSEGLPASFDVSVPKGGSFILDGRAVSLDEMDATFTRAEPYQIPVLVESDDTAALDVRNLAEEHGLPYRFPNYDKLLTRSADEALARAEAFIKTPPVHKGPWHAFGKHSALPLTVSLSLPGAAFVSGTVPKFVVSLNNTGNSPLRVADIKAHPYLMDNYLDLLLTQGGERVRDIPVFIADPGPSSPKDFGLLPADESFTVNYSGFPFALDHLKPGHYEATLFFYFDEMQTQRYVVSKTITFEVD